MSQTATKIANPIFWLVVFGKIHAGCARQRYSATLRCEMQRIGIFRQQPHTARRRIRISTWEPSCWNWRCRDAYTWTGPHHSRIMPMIMIRDKGWITLMGRVEKPSMVLSFSLHNQSLKPKANLLTKSIELANSRLKTPSQFRQRIFDFWGHLCINLPVKHPHLF